MARFNHKGPGIEANELQYFLGHLLYKALFLLAKINAIMTETVTATATATVTATAGNTKGGRITALLTSCLTGLKSAVRQLTIFVFICKTD